MDHNNIDINAGIKELRTRVWIIKDEISLGKLKNDNMSYIKNEYVEYFNSGYRLLSYMNIVPASSENLTCIEYTKERMKYILYCD